MVKTPGRAGLAGKLTAANAVFLLLLYLIESRIAERNWVATIVTYMPQHLFGLPVLLLLAWSLARRKWWIFLLNFGAAVFFASCMMGFNVPWQTPEPFGAKTVRIMTCNIHHAPGTAAQIAREVNASGADLVCIQEVNCFGNGAKPETALQKALPGWHHRCYGQLALISRYPIRKMVIHKPVVESWRVFMEVRVDVDGIPLSVINVHLNTAAGPDSLSDRRGSVASYIRGSTGARSAQIAELLRIIRGMQGPFVVAGDLNTPPRGQIYARLCNTLTDSFRKTGWGLGYSFRSDLPVMRIDYVFAGGDLQPLKCRTMGDVGSDHRPVLAELALLP